VWIAVQTDGTILLSAADMTYGKATQTIHVHSAASQQSEHDAVVAQLRLQLLSQNRQLMQIQKLVLGPKFGAHIVEQSNDQA